MQQEDGGTVRIHIGERTGRSGLCWMVGNGAAEEHGDVGVGIGAERGVGDEAVQIRGRIEGADALDAAGISKVAADVALKGGVIGGVGEKEGEVTTGGGAEDADAGGIEVEAGGVGAEPADGTLAVKELGGKGRDGGEAVIEADDGEVLRGHETDGTGVLATGVPSAAVDPDYDGKRADDFFWFVEIEAEGLVVDACVFEVALDFHGIGQARGAAGEEERGQQGDG